MITRWKATGTNTGPLLGAAPTGKPMKIFGFWMHRFEGDKIAEEWATWDTHGMLQQVGVSLPSLSNPRNAGPLRAWGVAACPQADRRPTW